MPDEAPVMKIAWPANAGSVPPMARYGFWRMVVSGLTFPPSAFLIESSACLITTGQLYAQELEPTRTTTTERSSTRTTLTAAF